MSRSLEARARRRERRGARGSAALPSSSAVAARPRTGVAGASCYAPPRSPSATFGDETRALELHRRAEEIEPRLLDVLSGLARSWRRSVTTAPSTAVAGVVRADRGRGGGPRARRRGALSRGGASSCRVETRAAGKVVSLSAALEKSRDVERASALVEAARRAAGRARSDPAFYERIARQSGDERLPALDYLERHAATAAATVAACARGSGLGRGPRRARAGRAAAAALGGSASQRPTAGATVRGRCWS